MWKITGYSCLAESSPKNLNIFPAGGTHEIFTRLVFRFAETVISKMSGKLFRRSAEPKSGESVVPIFDWTTFLSTYMTKIPSLTKKHYFMFCHENSGTVSTKECINGPEKDFDLLRDPSCTPSSSSELPPRIEPQGLTNERQWYLYESIAQSKAGIRCVHYHEVRSLTLQIFQHTSQLYHNLHHLLHHHPTRFILLLNDSEYVVAVASMAIIAEPVRIIISYRKWIYRYFLSLLDFHLTDIDTQDTTTL